MIAATHRAKAKRSTRSQRLSHRDEPTALSSGSSIDRGPDASGRPSRDRLSSPNRAALPWCEDQVGATERPPTVGQPRPLLLDDHQKKSGLLVGPRLQLDGVDRELQLLAARLD